MVDEQGSIRDDGAGEEMDYNEQARAAFARIGIVLDDGNGQDTAAFLKSLNGVADDLQQLRADNDALAKQLGQAQADAADASDKVATLEAAAAKAKAAAKVKTSDAKGRKIGAPAKSAEHLSPEQLLDAIRDADTVEIAFSDGKREIAGLPAQVIEGDAWKIAPGGLVLTLDELIVQAPIDTSLQLWGYGLVLDGKQVAWSPRGDGQLTIGSGTRFNLAPDIIFRAPADAPAE